MKTIIVGDVQGCLEELDELVKLVNYKKGEDRLVLAGDLLDRGPDSPGVVRRARELGAISVMGNHEAKHLRYRRARLRQEENPVLKNLVSMTPDKLADHAKLTEDDWKYIEAMPRYYFIDETKKWVVVHAGLERGLAIEDQDPDTLIYLRYVYKETGKRATLSQIDDGPIDLFDFWANRWDGPQSVFYGHHVSRNGPVINVGPSGQMAVGIDTGSCFGGSLTAAVMTDSSQFFLCSVPAKTVYASYNGWSADLSRV